MSERFKYSLIFAVLGAIFYIPFLGGVHLFDWDEVNFAEISREMLVLDEYLRVYVNFDPFWEKPPFFFWLQALGMAVFGVGEFAARLPNAICGVLTLVVLFNIGKTLKDTRFGIIWAGTYFGSILPFLYFKSGIIDPWFNLFIFLGLYFFILSYWKREKTEGIEPSRNHWFYLLIGGLMIGLGILTKGPVAYLIAALTMAVYWVYQRFRFYVNVPQFLLYTIAAFAIAAIWYASFFIDQFDAFNKYQYRLFSTPDAGHKGFPGYHFAVVLVGCFPASIFAIRSFFKGIEQKPNTMQDFTVWMKFLFWVVLILFTIVKSKIVHYSSMSYYPLTFLAALVIYNIIEGNITLNRWMRIGLWTIASLYLIVVFALPYAGFNIELIKPLFSKDAFALANLEAQVHWTGWEVLPGIVLLVLMIFSIRMILKGNKMQGFAVLFGGTAVFVMLTLISFIKRIEGYSQRAAVEFFESKANEDCYLMTYGYKSYVHLFYGKPQNGNKCCFKEEACTQKILHEPLDKPAYIVTKINKVNELKDLPGIIEIGRKNGFVFFKRE
ncbi:MAG: glycosyltransferase family 39 protein [Saprospiraceae bacterium]|nr:glycosyltransferase family 39 protein [Saprospiraceae bacterium]